MLLQRWGYALVRGRRVIHCSGFARALRYGACHAACLIHHQEFAIDALQWPAMIVTVAAAWLVASQSKARRQAGFWVFLLSNVLWLAWGWHSAAWALVVLQVALAAMNIRGAVKNESHASARTHGTQGSD